MAVTPFAQKYFPPVSPNIQPEVQQHLKLLYDAVNDHDQAITTQQSQVQAAAAAAAAASTSTNTVVTKTVTQIAGFPGLGNVNNQTGTVYTLQGADSGALVTLANAGAIAVTLNSTVATPYLVFMTNYGPGLATLTPSSGTVNGVTSYDLAADYTASVFFDGVNWWVTASQLTAADVTHAADVTAANTFGPQQIFTGGIEVGSPGTQGLFGAALGAVILEALIGTVAIGLVLTLFSGDTLVGIQSNTAEMIWDISTTQAGIAYDAVAVLETTPANFLNSSNTIEYQFGAAKNPTPGTLPGRSFAVGDVEIASTLPIVLPANPTTNLQAATKQYVDAKFTAGVSGTINLAKLTTGGTNGSITVAGGLITAFTNPT